MQVRGRGQRLVRSRGLTLAAVLPAAALLGAATSSKEPVRSNLDPRPPHLLRVCADPNNLPFSNIRREGFENRIADVMARALGRQVTYTWAPQRRGFIRSTLDAGACDVVMGEPSSYELVLTTRPYYRSSYVFVTRRDRRLRIRSLDDPRLTRLRVGIPVAGDDGASTPPAHALAKRGAVRNVVGYSLATPARLLEAVATGEVDVGIAWGPTAGWFAKRQRVPLEIVPVSPQIDLPFLPFVYDISMGVRRGDTTFRAALNDVIARRRAAIDEVLDAYGVPRVHSGGVR